MNSHQILIKAIEKAHNNCVFKTLGWNSFELLSRCKKWKIHEKEEVFPIIFSHDFAKAFWGDKSIIDLRGTRFQKDTDETESIELGLMVTWQFHLQQMVLEPEPLKYLEKFLEKEKEH